MDATETFVLLVYALIGISGALALLVFGWGFGSYITKLGSEKRIAGIRVMEWGVGLIFTTLFLIAVLRFLE